MNTAEVLAKKPFFFNDFIESKSIMPLRRKDLIRLKKNEKTLGKGTPLLKRQQGIICSKGMNPYSCSKDGEKCMSRIYFLLVEYEGF